MVLLNPTTFHTTTGWNLSNVQKLVMADSSKQRLKVINK